MPTPTLRQIAARCGVNVSTVSRALRGHGNIPPATQDRVQQAAAAMGWTSNPLAAAYMAHLRSTRLPARATALGFLIDAHGLGRSGALPGHVQLHLEGAQRQATSYGYELVTIMAGGPELPWERVDRMLFARNIPGLIVSAFKEQGTVIREVNWSRYAAVALGYSLEFPSLHCITANSHRGFHLLITKAYELGYRRLGVIVSEDYDRREDHGVLFPVAYAGERLAAGRWLGTLVLPSGETDQIGAVGRWLVRHRPQIVIGTDVAWDAIHALGWRIPRDIAFISVDRSPAYPQVAGFNQRHEIHGCLAVDMLVSQLTHNKRGIPEHPVLQLVDGCWEDGASAPRFQAG